jgi:type I restriction enzyme M protein
MVHVGEQKFHTPPELANFLVSLLPNNQFSSVIDICCGSWNLLNATKIRWPEINIIGIDLDRKAGLEKPKDTLFKLMDGRQYALYCIKNQRTFDLVVANPPFGKIDKKVLLHFNNFPLCLNLKGFACLRIETEMMIANALLVRPGGFLVAIVPSSFVEAESFKELRINFAKEFNVKLLVRLSKNAFKPNKIRSYIIVLSKKLTPLNNLTKPTYSFDASFNKSIWGKKFEYVLPKENIECGIWNYSVVNNVNIENIKTFRGKISSNDFSNKGVPVLHTSSPPKSGQIWNANTRFIKSHPNLSNLPFASDGDIIISRIGKSAGYWYIYSGKDILISDCLIVLKSSNQKNVLDFLNINSTNGCLVHLVKGLTTQYITENDLRSWISNQDNIVN